MGGYRHFARYLEKVFDWSAHLRRLRDTRQRPQHACATVFEAVFLGTALQMGSVHQLEGECRTGSLARRIGAISEDTVRYVLQRMVPDEVFALGCAVARRLKRNGLLRTTAGGGLIVAAVDGIELGHSDVRCCDRCQERVVDRHGCPATQYYHRVVVVAVVSTPFPIPLGVRFQRKGEGEAECARALLETLVARLGRRFIDVLVGDALYLGTSFVQQVETWGWAWVFTVKENQPALLAEVERQTAPPPPRLTAGARMEGQRWDLREVYWPVAERAIRVVKTVERMQRPRRVIVEEGSHRVSRTVLKETSHTNVFATNLSPGLISLEQVAAWGRSRWRIDTEVFQTLSRECGLKHLAVHQQHGQALVVLTMIRVLAYTLMVVFYHRQVLSHAPVRRPTFLALACQLKASVALVGPDSG
jgi:hypothetical protein